MAIAARHVRVILTLGDALARSSIAPAEHNDGASVVAG